MDPVSRPPASLESLTPAPYGRACVGCSRAKCKCFYRVGGSDCERCHRLGKACEQAITVRKRRARKASSRSAQSPPPRSLLEEKLDNVISLLRSQASAKKADGDLMESGPSNDTTPSTIDTIEGPITPMRDPDVVIDTTESVVHLLRPAQRPSDFQANPNTPPSPIADDVPLHDVPDWEAEQQLGLFRSGFLPLFPFVHIPATVSASELWHQKPFLWLVIMALTTKDVDKQFALADVFWKIVSRRVVCEHHANLDLLLGIIAFASWSHYFKKDKPFMTMLSQMAISLTFDLDLHKDVSSTNQKGGKSNRLSALQTSKRPERTLEERRTFVALFHLTSATWAGYRKTYPLDSTPYLEECVRIIGEGSETLFDILLAGEARCHLITNQLSSFSSNQKGGNLHTISPSKMLYTALSKELEDIRHDLQAHPQLEKGARFYLLSTELKIKECFLVHTDPSNSSSVSRIHRIQDLESVLDCTERLKDIFAKTSLVDWVGITVDTFTQLTHCLVVLFKLNTLNEPNWDLEEVKKRADVIQVLDQLCEMSKDATETLGVVEREGGQKGMLSKAPHIFRTIRMLMWAEMAPEIAGLTGLALDKNFTETLPVAGQDTLIPDEFIMSLANEPWLSDLMEYSWDYVDPLAYQLPEM